MEPTVDAEAMRRSAAGLRSRAQALGRIGARLDTQVAGMTYRGPAAERFRTTVAARRSEIARAAGELESMADALARAAITVEARRPAEGGLR